MNRLIGHLIKIGGCLILLAGCSRALGVRSEYFDITGRIFSPKPETQEVRLYEVGAPVPSSFEEIGRVNAWGPVGTSRAAFDQELERRARAAGADALLDVEYVQETSDDIIFLGRPLSKKMRATATGRAVITKGSS